jgi:lipopolysaccharide cholinephosphotransferase
MMPRPDYEVFIREFTHSNMALQNLENSDDTYIPFTKIYDTRTILIEHYATNGVFIDLFPIDGLPDEDSLGDYLKAQKSIFANLYNLHDYRTQDYLKYDKSLPQSMVKLKYWVKHLFYDSRDKSIRKLKKLYSQYSFDNSEYAGAICGAYGEKEHMQRSAFVEYMPIKFESRVYQCIASYDAYLKKHYGDYMTLPPLEKQCRTHSFEVYWKN